MRSSTRKALACASTSLRPDDGGRGSLLLVLSGGIRGMHNVLSLSDRRRNMTKSSGANLFACRHISFFRQIARGRSAPPRAKQCSSPTAQSPRRRRSRTKPKTAKMQCPNAILCLAALFLALPLLASPVSAQSSGEGVKTIGITAGKIEEIMPETLSGFALAAERGHLKVPDNRNGDNSVE